MYVFVIQYNQRTGEVQHAQFPDLTAATRMRIQLEGARTDEDVEIVSMMGESLAQIKTTHSRYFARDNGSPLTRN